jgi:hypothetical protein
MLIKRTYSIHILLAIFIFTNSCGINSNQNQNIIPTFSVNALMKAVQDITPAERNIASSICLAFKSKSQLFKTTDYLGTRFVFQTKQNSCGLDIASSSVNTILTQKPDGTLHYTSLTPVTDFYDQAQTDTSGYVSQVCSKIDNNLPISNTVVINGVTVQITFFKNVLDGFVLQYFMRLAGGGAQMLSSETYKFRTSFTYTVGKIMGMDEFYSKDSACAYDNTKTNHVEQTFTGR